MDKTTAGFVILLSALGGAGLTTLLGDSLNNTDIGTLWVCESKGLISDCVNGVKAEGTRCYHDPENGRKYVYCAEKWKEYNGYLDNTAGTINNIKVNANNKVWTCDIIDGRVDSYTKCVSGGYESYLGELI